MEHFTYRQSVSAISEINPSCSIADGHVWNVFYLLDKQTKIAVRTDIRAWLSAKPQAFVTLQNKITLSVAAHPSPKDLISFENVIF